MTDTKASSGARRADNFQRLSNDEIFAMRKALLEVHELYPLTQTNIFALCDMALAHGAELENWKGFKDDGYP